MCFLVFRSTSRSDLVSPESSAVSFLFCIRDIVVRLSFALGPNARLRILKKITLFFCLKKKKKRKKKLTQETSYLTNWGSNRSKPLRNTNVTNHILKCTIFIIVKGIQIFKIWISDAHIQVFIYSWVKALKIRIQDTYTYGKQYKDSMKM